MGRGVPTRPSKEGATPVTGRPSGHPVTSPGSPLAPTPSGGRRPPALSPFGARGGGGARPPPPPPPRAPGSGQELYHDARKSQSCPHRGKPGGGLSTHFLFSHHAPPRGKPVEASLRTTIPIPNAPLPRFANQQIRHPVSRSARTPDPNARMPRRTNTYPRNPRSMLCVPQRGPWHSRNRGPRTR